MKRIAAFVVLVLAIVTVARSGHEVPIYPSFYPHEIDIRTLAPEQAADTLRDGKIQAYVGRGLSYAGTLPADLRAIESLGAFVVLRINPQSHLATDRQLACAAVKAVIRGMAGQANFVSHPYPVTPFHGDYLHHADLAAAAKARFSDGAGEPIVRDLKIKASGSLKHPDWPARDADWDVEIVEVDAADLVAHAAFAMNGWIAPPWVRSGWFHAERLLAKVMNDHDRKQRAEADRARLMRGDYASAVERINLERDLVAALIGGCQTIVAGYTVKREFVNVEFSAGIENIGYDAFEGLRSSMFIRTVKLKDFPWNGWLMLGTDAKPASAWNPIGGMTDPLARLMWVAVGDPALLPSPYDAGWMLNRIADLPANARR